MMNNPLVSSNYPLPKVSITASQVGTRITVSLGGSFQQAVWIEANNETPYILSVFDAQGILLTSIQPQFVDIAQIPQGDTFFTIIPSLLIPQAAPSSEVDINVYPFGKPEGAYPSPLARQSSPVASTGKNAYFQDATITGVTGTFAVFNVFNPLNSGLVYVFYSAVINPGSTAGTVTDLILFRGADLNLTNQGTANPHDLNQPTSLAHCTAGNVASLSATSIPKQRLNTPVNIDTELLPFPDQVTAHPGDNVTLSSNLGNGLSGSAYLTWTEQ